MTELRNTKKTIPVAWEAACAAGRKLTALAPALHAGWTETINVARRTVWGAGYIGGDRSWLPSLRRGLFRKYAALLVGLVGIALIVSATIEAHYSFGESRDALIAVQREKAQGAAALIEQFVKEIEAQLSWATGFLPTGGGIEQRRLDFLRLLRQAPAITEVTYADGDGREQIKVSRLAMDTLASGTDLSQEPKFAHARANKRYIGPVFFRKESEPYLTMALAGAGRSAGVTIAEVNLKFIWDVVSRIKVGEAGVAYVVDDGGLLIAHPDIGIVLRKTDLSRLTHVAQALARVRDPTAQVPAISYDRMGREVLTASAPIGTLGWLVLVDLPLAEALKPVYAVLYRTMIVLAASLLLAGLAGIWLARRMVVPIQTLASGAARIGGGDLDHRIELRSGDEVEVLATSFNEMGGRLKEYYAGLEHKVAERTRELSESLEQQTATGEILRVISSSPTDVQPVFDAIASSAARLCEAIDVMVLRTEGDVLRLVGHHGPMPAGDVALHRGTLGGRTVLERRMLHIRDLQAEVDEFPEGSTLARERGHRTTLSVPLLKEGMAIGNIQVRRNDVRSFSDRQISLLQTFADQAVIAIDNVHLFEAEQARTKELTLSLEYQTATSEILNVISRSPAHLQPVLDAIAAAAARLCQAQYAFVWRLDAGKARVAASNKADEEFLSYQREHPTSTGRGNLVGRVLLECRTVHIHDVLADPEYTDLERQRSGGFRTVLGVPLLRDEEPIGVINLIHNTIKPFTEKQIELVETFADQAVIAIENARLFEEVQARTRELTTSLEQQTATGEILGSISASMTDPQPVFDAIVRNVNRLFGAQFANVQLLRDGIVYMPASGGEPRAEELARNYPRPVDHTTVGGQAVLTKQVVQYSLGEGSAAPPATQDFARGFAISSVLAAPMIHKGKVIGAIGAAREAKAFDDKEVALIKAFAEQAVIAIENARLFEEVQARTAELSRSVAELKALAQVGQAVNSSLDLKTVLHAILGHACEMSDTTGGAIYVLDEARSGFVLEAGHNMTAEHLAAVREHPIRRGEFDRRPVRREGRGSAGAGYNRG